MNLSLFHCGYELEPYEIVEEPGFYYVVFHCDQCGQLMHNLVSRKYPDSFYKAFKPINKQVFIPA